MTKRRDIRRYYYDMEPVYQKVEQDGGLGWPVESAGCLQFLIKWTKEEIFRPGVRLLEIGCGGGELALIISKRDSLIVEACDFSETAIKICQKKDPPQNLTFFVANAMTHRGFPNPPYDYIIANQFFQGIIGGDRLFFLKRVRENLSHDGVAIISTMLGIPSSMQNEFNPVTRVNSGNTIFFADMAMFADELSKSHLKAIRHIKVDEHYKIFFLVKS